MAKLLPDQTFYTSAKTAMAAAPEKLAYVAMLNPTTNDGTDAMAVVDLDPASKTYGSVVSRVDMPNAGDELHHFGWNACSSTCAAFAPSAHRTSLLVVPGMRSRAFTWWIPSPTREPRNRESHRAGRSEEEDRLLRPHTVHCGPDGIYLNALGIAEGDGPGGILMLDPETFEIKGAWEADRGPQRLAYDFWWHLGHDTMITSEWGTPNMVEDGVNPEFFSRGKYGHALHVWDLKRRTHSAEDRPRCGAADGVGAAGRRTTRGKRTASSDVAMSLCKIFRSSIFMWYRDTATGDWAAKKVIEIPAEPADPDDLPELLKGFKAVPPLVTDINLSLDDRFLYVSCWGTGELRQYDVTDPSTPKLTGSVRIGGIAKRAPHPKNPAKPLNGGPQMVEVSRDGRRVYVTNSLYTPWDAQFYPDGIHGWVAKVDADSNGGIAFDQLFLETPDGLRPHQVRLEGGDASSDSFCFS